MQTQYQTATEWAAAIARREIGSLEALDYFLARCEQHNPRLNAVVTLNVEGARQRAREADAALARGESWGPLHGLPMTAKDVFEVVGMPTTAGAPELAGHLPARNADAIQRLLDAGAIIFGKTNIPLYALDFQAYNSLHGTTNNPYDLTRTPGGSSGGSAAALAAGLTPLEIGSDLAGSIRLPAHFCGVYGHKPTIGVIPLRGHIPGPPGSLAEGDLAVAGPMGMSAADLALGLEAMVGARAYDAVGVTIRLPAPRRSHLAEYRVACWFDDPVCPVDNTMLTRYREVVGLLRGAGVSVTEITPLGKPLEEYVSIYTQMLGGLMGAMMPASQYRMVQLLNMAMPLANRFLGFSSVVKGALRGATQRYKDYAALPELREQLRFALRAFFDDYDLLLTPVAMTQAYPHQHEGDVFSRKLTVNGQPVAYADTMRWNAFATLIGLPATSAPVGMVDHLPMNIQIIGSAYRDYETIAFAGHIAEVTGPAARPADFA